MAKITLKKRPAKKELVVSSDTIDAWKGFDDKKLIEVCRSIVENGTTEYAHDLRWLKMIVDWSPPDGFPLSEMAKWMQLATKISGLKEEKEYKISLGDFHINMIWERITSEKFKLNSLPLQFQQFILDFQQATGKHFKDEDPAADEIEIEEV